MSRVRCAAPAMPIRLGVSGCLLGEPVRYDGRHKRNALVTGRLARYFEFVPFCPEVAIGMGVPRPPIQLVRADGVTRARGVETPTLDVTAKLARYARHVVPQFAGVSGYVLKSNSPSCGMAGVKVFSTRGKRLARSAGVYAEALQKLLPELPFDEETRLVDPARRENFIERVLVYRRWQELTTRPLTVDALADFHARHRFTILAHGLKAAREMERLVSGSGRANIAKFGQRYIGALMRTLAKPATRAGHMRVLCKLASVLREALGTDELRALAGLIDGYRRGGITRHKVIQGFRRFLGRFPDPALAVDYYLNPHPAMKI